MNDVKIWDGPTTSIIPASMYNPSEIVTFANNLNITQKKQIAAAFDMEAYEMASEYVWRLSLTKLKESLKTLGIRFIGEMLGRNDIDEFSPIDDILTDYSTIQLSEQLGVIGSTAAFKLKQAHEIIIHHFSNKADEELDSTSAMQILKSCIQYILSERNISVAVEFSKFRNRLLNEDLVATDEAVYQIINSPIFYLRTLLTVLLSAMKNEQGATFEHSASNLILILPLIWDSITDGDKWNVGSIYRDVTTEGNANASVAIKKALLKVKGFDYVPETLRSNSFIRAAKEVIAIHFAGNNFYNEPIVIKKLANMGSAIPTPAFSACMQAYLIVYLGNKYNPSWDAAAIAEEQLKKISTEKWSYYFSKVLESDEVILEAITESKPFSRLKELLLLINDFDVIEIPPSLKKLVDALKKNNFLLGRTEATSLISKIRNGK